MIPTYFSYLTVKGRKSCIRREEISMPLELLSLLINGAPPHQFQTQTHMPEKLEVTKSCVPSPQVSPAEHLHICLWAVGQPNGWCSCLPGSSKPATRSSSLDKSFSELREASNPRSVCVWESGLPCRVVLKHQLIKSSSSRSEWCQQNISESKSFQLLFLVSVGQSWPRQHSQASAQQEGAFPPVAPKKPETMMPNAHCGRKGQATNLKDKCTPSREQIQPFLHNYTSTVSFLNWVKQSVFLVTMTIS